MCYTSLRAKLSWTVIWINVGLFVVLSIKAKGLGFELVGDVVIVCKCKHINVHVHIYTRVYNMHVRHSNNISAGGWSMLLLASKFSEADTLRIANNFSTVMKTTMYAVKHDHHSVMVKFCFFSHLFYLCIASVKRININKTAMDLFKLKLWKLNRNPV